MATLLGVVRTVVGEVYAVAGDGTRRLLAEGDRVFVGEQIVTGAGGAVAIRLNNGGELTVGRDSSLTLTEQMLAATGQGDAQVPQDSAESAAPSQDDLTDVEQLQAAIEAGVDPTQVGEATAAGPGAGGAAGGAGGAGGVGGGHSFVLLAETAGALDPVIGYPTEGFNTGPEFPDPEPEVDPDPEPAPVPVQDFTPDIDVEYQDAQGTVVTGPAVVDEEALADGSNPPSGAEQASGRLVINSPDGVSAIQIQDVNGNWIDVTNGGVVQGLYGVLNVDAAGNWTYTLTDNTLAHEGTGTGSADQVGESFLVRMFDLDGDVSPSVPLDVSVYDDGPSISLADRELNALVVDESNLALNDQGSFASAFQFNPGADGGAVTYSLQIMNLDSGLVDSASGASIELHLNGSVIEGWVGGDSGVVAFRISVNDAGEVSWDQLRAFQHGDPTDRNEATVLGGGLIELVATVVDGDGDSASASLDLGGVLVALDDGPNAQAQPEASAGTMLDESLAAPNGADDGVNPGVISAATIAGLFAAPVFGADGAGSSGGGDGVSYALQATDGAQTGLWLTGESAPADEILLVKVSETEYEGREGGAGGTLAFSIVINANTGEVTITQYATLEHVVDGAAHDDALTLEADIRVVQTVEDADSDTDSATSAAGLVITFEDDGPQVLAASNLVYANAANTTTGGTGIFEYRIGADARTSYSSSNSDFSSILLAGTVGVGAIINPDVGWVSETDSQAVFNVSFKYDKDPVSDTNELSDASGTLTFDKVAGTYTLKLNAPLEGYTFLKTSETQSKESFNLVGESDSQPEIVVSKLADNFFIRFTASEEVGGKDKVDLNTSDGDTALEADETFVASQTWVSISGSENGVASDTLQAGEVLNMDFYTASPGNNPNPGPGNALASVMYLKLGQLGDTEDMVVLLKLINPVTNNIETRVVVVGAEDIYRSNEINPYGINFSDGSDGVVIIEANDYNAPGENYLIYGAQLLVSTEGVDGSGINLNRQTGALGGSSVLSGLISFAADAGNQTTETADGDVIKVVDIGLLSPQTNTLDANLNFSFNLIDADGDVTSSQQLSVDIVSIGSLIGDASDQVLQATNGNNLIDGNEGVDTASYLHAASGVNVSLNVVAAQATGGSGSDTLSDIENLIGSNYADSLTGNSLDNILWGLGGNDTLSGGAGNDVLLGGQGNDLLQGGTGKDTYVWRVDETGTDTVVNFTPKFASDAEGDRLDLSELLDGGVTGGVFNGEAELGNLLSYLQISTEDAGVGTAAVDTVIRVEASGGDFTTPTQTIVLQDVNLYEAYKEGMDLPSPGDLITKMLDDGTLKVDTV